MATKFLVRFMIEAVVDAPNEDMAKDIMAHSISHTVALSGRVKKAGIRAEPFKESPIINPFNRDGVKPY